MHADKALIVATLSMKQTCSARSNRGLARASLCAAATILAVAPMAAHAATVIVTGGNGGYGSGPAPVNVSRFDTSLGTLTSVTVSYVLTSIFSGALGRFDSAPRAATVSIDNGYAYLKDAGGNILVDGTFSGTSASIDVPPAPGFGPPGVIAFNYAAPAVAGTLAPFTSAMMLAAFTGGGAYTFTVGGTPGDGTISDPSLNFGGFVNPTDSVSVQYDYDAIAAVPEPATWTMMIAGIGAIGFALRRRRMPQTRVTFA